MRACHCQVFLLFYDEVAEGGQRQRRTYHTRLANFVAAISPAKFTVAGVAPGSVITFNSIFSSSFATYLHKQSFIVFHYYVSTFVAESKKYCVILFFSSSYVIDSAPFPGLSSWRWVVDNLFLFVNAHSKLPAGYPLQLIYRYYRL